MDAFNKAVDGIVLSWSPGEVALDTSGWTAREKAGEVEGG